MLVGWAGRGTSSGGVSEPFPSPHRSPSRLGALKIIDPWHYRILLHLQNVIVALLHVNPTCCGIPTSAEQDDSI